MRDQLQKSHWPEDLARRFHLAAIYVFGSRAGEIAARVAGSIPPLSENDESDVNVGVLPLEGHALAPWDKVRLAQAIEDALGVARVDIVVLSEAPPFLAASIVSGELIAVTDPDQEAEYQLFALRRAGDLAPFERERIEGWLEGTLEPR